MGKIFEFNSNFGPWTLQNIIIFQITAYHIMLLQLIIESFPNHLREEKFWLTLSAIIIAPSNRFNLLLGMYISNLIIVSFPFVFFLILCVILFPISLITLFSIFLIYFFISLTFSGMGLTLGIFAISNENIWRIVVLLIKFGFLLSCITYPFEIFPEIIQNIINANPLYYMIDLVRLTWIENNIIETIILHPLHILILSTGSISLPIIGVFFFNLVYDKYGIVGE